MTWSKLTKPVLSSKVIFYCFCWEVWKRYLPKGTHSFLSLQVNASWSLSIDGFSQPTFSSYCVWKWYSHLVAVLFLCWIFADFFFFFWQKRGTQLGSFISLPHMLKVETWWGLFPKAQILSIMTLNNYWRRKEWQAEAAD